MSDLGRRSTIDDIKLKYKLEPSLSKTIYVEGSSDKSLIELFLKKVDIKDFVVFEIQMLEVPTDELFKLGLEDNNRDRIIILSLLINQGVIGIIDSDFYFLEEPTFSPPSHLLFTDYSAMELYGFNEEVLEKILLGYPPKQRKSYQELLSMLSNILVEIFLIRFAKKSIDKSLPHSVMNKELSLKKESNIIDFDRDTYLKKYLSNQKDKIKKFDEVIDNIKKTLPADIRKIIHGHDFIDLLMFYLEIKQRDAKEVFKKSFYSSFDFNLLKKEKMFHDLIEILK